MNDFKVGDIVGYYTISGITRTPTIVGEAVVISKDELIMLYRYGGFRNNLPFGITASYVNMNKEDKYFNTEIRVKEKEIKQ